MGSVRMASRVSRPQIRQRARTNPAATPEINASSVAHPATFKVSSSGTSTASLDMRSLRLAEAVAREDALRSPGGQLLRERFGERVVAPVLDQRDGVHDRR